MFKSLPSNEESAIEEILDRVNEAHERVSYFADSLDNARSDSAYKHGVETLEIARSTDRRLDGVIDMITNIARENRLQAQQIKTAEKFHNSLYRHFADILYQRHRIEGTSADHDLGKTQEF